MRGTAMSQGELQKYAECPPTRTGCVGIRAMEQDASRQRASIGQWPRDDNDVSPVCPVDRAWGFYADTNIYSVG